MYLHSIVIAPEEDTRGAKSLTFRRQISLEEAFALSRPMYDVVGAQSTSQKKVYNVK
jgi:hypothetical protein